MNSVEINVCLSRPKYASNIGAAARACANLGIKNLSLIDPKVDPFAERSRKAAAGANDHLDRVMLYETKSHFTANNTDKIIIGLSRRGGKSRPSQDLKTTLKHISEVHSDVLFSGGLHLIFGPEDHGLDTSEIEMCHYTCKLPKMSEFQSFNLAQAVLLSLFITQDSLNSYLTKEHQNSENLEATIKIADVEEVMQQWLLAIGMNLDSKRVNSFKVLKRMIKKSAPSQRELRLFEKVLQQTVRLLTLKK